MGATAATRITTIVLFDRIEPWWDATPAVRHEGLPVFNKRDTDTPYGVLGTCLTVPLSVAIRGNSAAIRWGDVASSEVAVYRERVHLYVRDGLLVAVKLFGIPSTDMLKFVPRGPGVRLPPGRCLP